MAHPLDAAAEHANQMLYRARAADWSKADGSSAAALITSTIAGDGVQRPSYGQAREQLDALRGWCFAGARVLANRVAAQRICVADESSAGTRMGRRGTVAKAEGESLEPFDSHPLLDAIDNPVGVGTRQSLLVFTVLSLEATGRALWWCPVTDGKRSIFPVPATWLQEVDRARATWVIRPDGATASKMIPGDEMTHFCYPDPADPFGVCSPFQRLARAINTDDAISTAHVQAFENGIFPKVMLRVGQKPALPGMTSQGRPTLTPEQRRQIIDAIKLAYSGVARFDEPLILDGLIEDAKKLSNTPAELDFLNSAGVARSRILRGMGINDISLGEVEGANRASAVVADESFVANRVNPLITLLSTGMTKSLAPLFAGPNQKLKVWIEPAQARDSQQRFQQYKFAGERGAITVNEYRKRVLNMPEIPGGDKLMASAPAAAPPTPVSVGKGAAEQPPDWLAALIDPALNPYTCESLRN